MFNFAYNPQELWAYFKVFLLLLGGSLGLPIPEDLSLLVAGVLISSGDANALLMGLVCYIGVVGGDLIIYRAGHLAGPALFKRRWFRRRINATKLNLIRENLERRGLLTIFIARHLFYIRTITFLMCGALRLNFLRFFLFDCISALVTVPLLVGLGYMGAEHFDYILQVIKQVKLGLLAVGLVTLAFAIWRWRKIKVIDDEEEF